MRLVLEQLRKSKFKNKTWNRVQYVLPALNYLKIRKNNNEITEIAKDIYIYLINVHNTGRPRQKPFPII